ncbi:phenylalanine 4-monooxygenase [Rubrivivax gelatinosus]|uniref:Phenylalanine-4-hydroxylase n=1 Tax=Rubrivivax gelatinosus TaxID=28068 RepID=A0ABS1DXY0_RUBGE|nr:phenylalanine 4-monooxygenase [Rubrivivax gelatinosus]MBK1714671.1 phenylalanine 4-monooxygenase [Rubrivivax gelatinosus]
MARYEEDNAAGTVADSGNEGSAPVTYGEGDRPPRGDYGRARADYTCEQQWSRYSEADHDTYRRLHARQLTQLPGKACDEFIAAVDRLGPAESIPRFEEVSRRLERRTGWRIVAVPGLIPELAFFRLLAARRFPVTDWIRRPEEFDYVVEPDVFHDLFGHVPLLFDPVFADYMQAYGAGGLKAARLGECELLARLYWFTVEFGLLNTAAGLRAYGAGILSSAGELPHALQSPQARRLRLDLPRMMRSRYRIDTFQPTYFVIDSFAELFDATAPDFAALYARVRRSIETDGEIEAGDAAAEDQPAVVA